MSLKKDTETAELAFFEVARGKGADARKLRILHQKCITADGEHYWREIPTYPPTMLVSRHKAVASR